MKYIIWSHRHREWWQADRSGYTSTVVRAGEYSAIEAGEITLAGLPGASTAVDIQLRPKFAYLSGDEVEELLETLRRL
jgi:hypothetical protein